MVAERVDDSGSLTIVGTGIRLVGQVTLEALTCMRQAEVLLYLVADAATERWIRGLNAAAESLDDCYAEGKPRERTYAEMVRRIMARVREGRQVCVAFYGHPAVFVDPSHRAIRQARREGFPARMLPGISAEACLFADLGVDPADAGCQSFEATSFLLQRPRFDPTVALILWQVGFIAEFCIGTRSRPGALALLAGVLARAYPRSHRVVVYVAPQFPVCEPVIVRVPLARLERFEMPPLATLYVPPLPSRYDDERMAARLGLDDQRKRARSG